MADSNKVQLKREELVGDEIVLSDINPITDTQSVEDVSKGISLSATLERIWNVINDKLSRIVNSVNGRTGVVVLSSEDVGLGNVDNISFDDIKKWVIEQIEYAFKVHQIQLFDSLEEVAEFINNHDETYSGTPFFSEHGYIHPSMSYPDMKSYIGYFEYDETENMLVAHMKPINTVGATDNSIIYNTKVGDKDFRGGKIGVNIYRYEEALKLYNANSGDTATDASLLASGLYIDRSKLVPQLHYYDSCYGDGTPTDENAFLYFQNDQPEDAKEIQFLFNGTRVLSTYTIYTKQTFNVYDLIYCNFNDTNCLQPLPEQGAPPVPIAKTGIIPDLLKRQPCIGQITQAPTPIQPTLAYIVNFVSIKPYVGYGLTYYRNHVPAYSPNRVMDTTLGISGLKSKPNEFVTTETDVSGITTFSDDGDTRGDFTTEHGSNSHHYISTPIGRVNICDRTHRDGNTNNGLIINLNDGLCTIPAGSDNFNNVLENWPKNLPEIYSTSYSGKHVGSYIGPNLDKQVFTGMSDAKYAFNMSGLRITKQTDELDSTWFGRECDDWDEFPTHSGGISVNVGDFLSIGKSGELSNETNIPTRSTYYDIGKVNVNIDETKGLYNSGNNKIGIKATQPVAFTEIGNMLTVNRGTGIMASFSYDEYGTRLSNDTGKKTLSVALVDSKSGILNWEPQSDGTLSDDVKKMYGGLRYITNPYINGKGVVIGLRVNDEAAWDDGVTSGRQTIEPPQRLGSKAVGIDENNVVGVQLYKSEEDPNPLLIKGRVVHKIELPIFTGEDEVTSADADVVLHDYSDIQTAVHVNCYVNISENKIYSDFTRRNQLELEENQIYFDLTTKPAPAYKCVNGRLQYLKDSRGNLIDTDWVNKADIDHDGVIDSSDASAIYVFLSKIGQGVYTNDLSGFKQFVWDEYKITDSYDYMPGLMVRYNTHEGIIAHDCGVGSPEIRDRNTLSISIKDYSNGYTNGESYDDSDPTPQFDRNGLRFTTGGMISVKVNDHEGYLSTTQAGRLIVDTENGVGTKGLCIDDRNVLGIQLSTDGSTDNGFLAFDTNGCLTISESFRPVTDITLGPGLIWGE